MSVRVRMAPSPTGFLHVGGVRTFLFNWLFARRVGGECRLRIENTDTGREVAEAVDQIQRSLLWLGIDWDGPVTFQLDRQEAVREQAEALLLAGAAYLDEGAIRFRMPDEGAVAWEDAVRGRIEFENANLSDLVLVRSDGRPTYNFASPVEDFLDGITHVIRGNDHVSNTPTQINILSALGAELPIYAHVPDVLGDDGKKLSKRHGAVSIDAFRAEGYLPEALMNFLALLGWSYDDKTTVMTPGELIERFSLERVGQSPATFDYKKLDWLNGVYLRELTPAGLRGGPDRLARATGDRLAGRARPPQRPAHPGEARAFLAVSRLRALPLRAGEPRRRRPRHLCGGGSGACRGRAVAGRADRGRPPRPRARARAQAA